MRHFLLFFTLFIQIHLLFAQEKRPRYESVEPFEEGMAMVTKEGKIGFIDRSYQEVIPPVYLNAYGFSEGLAAVEIEDSVAFENGMSVWVFIDKTGKQVVPGQYEWIVEGFREGVAIVMQEGKKQIIDKVGRVLMIESKQLPIVNVKHNMVMTKSDKEKAGVLNFKGDIVVPVEFDEVKILSPKLVVVSNKGKYGFYNTKGKRLTKLIYEEYELQNNGSVSIMKKDKWGLLSKEGKEIVSPIYDDISSYQEGFAKVKKDEKVGFINEVGKAIVSVKYDWADDFLNGKATVELDGNRTYINTKGSFVDENYMDIGMETKDITKEAAEKLFLDFLNALISEYPYTGDISEGGLVSDSLFSIRNGVLSGTFKKHTYDEVVLERITVPVSRLTEVWYDYNMGLYVDNAAGVVQNSKPGSAELTKEYKTDMLYLASPGDGYHGLQWQAKLQVALNMLKRFYK